MRYREVIIIEYSPLTAMIVEKLALIYILMINQCFQRRLSEKQRERLNRTKKPKKLGGSVYITLSPVVSRIAGIEVGQNESKAFEKAKKELKEILEVE